MAYVKANPLRDPGVFCATPPCPLCYDWAEGEGQDTKVQNGLKRYVEDVLAGRPPSPEANRTLIAVARNIHAANLVALKAPPASIPSTPGETFEDPWEARQLAAFLKQRLPEAMFKPQQRVIDHIDFTEEEVKALEENQVLAPLPPTTPDSARDSLSVNQVTYNASIASPGAKLQERYTPNEFAGILEMARRNAKPGFETDFVISLKERATKYGGSMFLSQKQESLLLRIAKLARMGVTP